jgi:hypothetical protein
MSSIYFIYDLDEFINELDEFINELCFVIPKNMLTCTFTAYTIINIFHVGCKQCT